MDTIKQTAQKITGSADAQLQEYPGLERDMDPKPKKAHLPSEDEGYTRYKAAGKLAGKKALITGGDSGIGRAAAVLFAMEGADVTISYLPEEEEDAQHTRDLVRKNGGQAHIFTADLRNPNEAESLVKSAVDAMGGLDIVVNNAAYQKLADDISKVSNEQWERTFRTNIFGYFYVAKAAMPHLKSGSSIVNVASVNAYVGPAQFLDYSSTKGAIVSFTRSLSSQQVSKGIRVNAVAPGPIWTPLIVATMPGESVASFGQQTPMGRPGQPSEVATCIVFLASSDSSYISGQTLHPNGGTVVNG